MPKYRIERPNKRPLTIVTKKVQKSLEGQIIGIWYARGGRAVSVSASERDAYNQLLSHLRQN